VRSVERLCREVAGRLAEVRDVVLDFRRVSRIDRATTRLIIELVRQCGEAGVSLGLSAPPAAGLLASGLVDMLSEQPETAPAFVADLDSALDAAEERLPARPGSSQTSRAVSLAEMEVCGELDVDDLAALAVLRKRMRFRAGDEVTRPGDVSSSAWFILAGSMTVRAAGPDSEVGRGYAPSDLARSSARWPCCPVLPARLGSMPTPTSSASSFHQRASHCSRPTRAEAADRRR
jgi:ABC-type transporter Mla MlaB component